MSDQSKPPQSEAVITHRLRTPHSAADAGIVFAVLTVALRQSAIPADPPTDPGWLTEDESQVTLAVTLVPFAAIAFLWFIGVRLDVVSWWLRAAHRHRCEVSACPHS